MDASDTRRGRPATHRALEAEHRAAGWRGDPEQYGAAAAILLGDLLQGWADELLRRCGFGWDRVGPALEVFDLCRTEVIAGQFLDVSVQARGRADVETAMTVLRYKSAKYSIERPLHVGAALAGADAEQLAALTAFGLPLGEAFQLRDDLLGVFGDPATTGKPAGDDLVEGKRTVLVALALDARRSRATPPCSTARSAPRSRRRRSSGCATSSTPAAPTPRSRPSSPSSPASRSPPSTGPTSTTGPAEVLRGLAAAVTQRVV